jgi:S1-C subfamily serine protease
VGVHPNLAGATFGETEKNAKARVKGVAVTRVEAQSPASELGLREGDVITSVNWTRVDGLEEFNKLVRQSGASQLLGMRRGASSVYVLLR